MMNDEANRKLEEIFACGWSAYRPKDGDTHVTLFRVMEGHDTLGNHLLQSELNIEFLEDAGVTTGNAIELLWRNAKPHSEHLQRQALEERIAKSEAQLAHIRSNIRFLKSELKKLNKQTA